MKTNYAFKPTAGDVVRFERLLPASGGLTQRQSLIEASMQPTELEEARRFFAQAELETDPERKFSLLKEALDLTDDLFADHPDSPDMAVAKNLRRSNLRILLSQLVNMRSLEIDVWFNYIRLFLLRVKSEVESIILGDPALRESYRKFMDLWRDEIIAALERAK